MQIMEVGSPLQVAKEMLHVYVRSMIYVATCFFFPEGIEKKRFVGGIPSHSSEINRSEIRGFQVWQYQGEGIIDLVFSPFLTIFHHFSPSLYSHNEP